MRFMIQVRATATSERGDPPGPEYAELFEQMGAFHEEMARAELAWGVRGAWTCLQ